MSTESQNPILQSVNWHIHLIIMLIRIIES